MVVLTKLNRQSITLNAVYFESIEATPDTIITLVTGKKYVVMESVEEVIEKVSCFYKKIHIFQVMREGIADD